MNFEREVLNILETIAYKLAEEEKVPIVKNSPMRTRKSAKLQRAFWQYCTVSLGHNITGS